MSETAVIDKETSNAITSDLMRKVGDDVSSAIVRVLSIAPDPHIPVAAAASAASLGVLARCLHDATDMEPPAEPDPKCILLAGLIAARMGIGGDDPIGHAYRDLAALTSDTGEPVGKRGR